MNFFEHQDKARKKTGLLVFLFTLGVLCILAGTVGIVYGVLYYVGFEYPQFHYLIKEEPLWIPICAAVLIVIALGTLIRTLQMLGGGISVAEMVGAQPIGPNPSFEVKRFLNVVDEMAIASGVPVPALYLLDDPSINAFVAGRKPKDTVMVVTQGALDNLNRQELQAVVGHEFSHIFNTDIKISLRLIGLLGGILAIGQIGYFLMRFSGLRGRSRSGKGGSHAAVILIGLGLFILGYIGLFFGRVIKAAISREREILADACSVQYTRNPHGLVSAFKVMQMHQEGTHLSSSHSEDVNHFCFAPALSIMFGSLLATHPPLEKRIQRIDPQGQYDILPRPTKEEEKESPQKDSAQAFIPMMLATSIIVANAEQVKQSIAQPTDEHVDYAQAINTLIPDELRAMARDPEQVIFLLYALILPEEFAQKKQTLTGLRDQYSEQDIQKVVMLKGLMHQMPQAAFLPLFEFALPTFSQLSKELQIQTYQKLHQLMSAFEGDTFHYVLSILLAKQIQNDIAFKKESPQTLKGLLREVMYLLVVLLKASHQSEDEQKQCFKQISQSLFNQSLPWPKVQRIKFDLLTKALEKINGLKPLEKEKVINACIEVITFDGKVLVPEAELLRAVCEVLECPMPPLLNHKADND